MTTPWYKSGLRFRCSQCGHCCTGAPGAVWVTEEDIARIAAHRGETAEAFAQRNVRLIDGRLSLTEKWNGECVLYDSNRGCTVYPVRPRQCRTYPFWRSVVATPQTWAEEATSCAGIGQGEVVRGEEIQRMVDGL